MEKSKHYGAGGDTYVEPNSMRRNYNIDEVNRTRRGSNVNARGDDLRKTKEPTKLPKNPSMLDVIKSPEYNENQFIEEHAKFLDRTPYKLGKAKGGSVKSSASKRADGCAIRGKTRA